MLALTRLPDPSLTTGCALTHLDRVPIDWDRALEQHASYRAALTAAGCMVRVLPPLEGWPDAVFVEDVAVHLPSEDGPGLTILCRPGIETRAAEPGALRPELEHMGPLAAIEAPGHLEGGDVLRVGRRIFVGRSGRTDAEGLRQLTEFAGGEGYEVIPVPLGPALHLKTACTALDDETLLLNPDWVGGDSFEGLRILTVHPSEPFAANVVRVPPAAGRAAADDTLLTSASWPRTREGLAREGFDVTAVPISEFEKAEAGASCMSVLLRRDGGA